MSKLIEEANQYQEELRRELEQQEYEQRKYYWVIHYSGNIHLPTKLCFHPHGWCGTKKEFDYIYDNYLTGKEDEFKIIGWETYDTFDEMENRYKTKEI